MISIANKQVKLFNLDLLGPSIGYNSPIEDAQTYHTTF
jgi:hypothetical protein